jgi:hypothetical protein
VIDSPLAILLARHRRRLRVLFWVYAAALFTATHWPALELHVPYIERPDLIIHFGCFGSWFGLFWLAGYIGPPLRVRSILLSIPVAVLYAGFDEGLQALPFVRRHCAWDDFFANCGGILLAALVASAITWLSCRRSARGSRTLGMKSPL